MPKSKLTELERRAIARAVAKADGGYGSVATISRSYGITRARVYQIIRHYTDPRELERLRDEVSFRQALIRQVKRTKGEAA